ncbi:hypothetical protein N9K16_02820 [Alphaproteobacteria bacterium]|nr:hypothetical protein [Alphaproteobacteria bacterium]
MSFKFKILSATIGGVLVSALWSLSAGAQSVDQVKAVVEDGLSRGMSIAVAGRLSNGSVSVIVGDNNDFDVKITGADLYEVSLPEIEFSITQLGDSHWSVTDGRLSAPVDYRGGNGHDEATLDSFEWSGTWNSQNNEYLGISVSLGKFRIQGREFGVEIESFDYRIGDQDDASNAIAVDYSMGAVSYSFGVSSAVGEGLEGVPSDISGNIEAMSSNAVMVAIDGYRTFQWLSLLSDAVGEADTIEDDVAKQAAYMRGFVQSIFQGIDNSKTTYNAQNYNLDQVVEGSLINSLIRTLSGSMETSHNDDGTVRVVAKGDAEDYVVSGRIEDLGGDINFAIKWFVGDSTLHGFDAAGMENVLLSLIDRYETGELEEPLPSDIIQLVQSIGGVSFYQAVQNISGSTSFMGPMFDAGLIGFDLKVGAPMEEGNRLESEYGLTIDGFSTPFVAMHPAGPVVAPTKAVLVVGLQHDSLSTMIDNAGLTEEERTAFETDIDAWEDDDRTLDLFTKVWNGSPPLIYGDFEVEGPGYDLEIEWEGDITIGKSESPYDPPAVSGQVDIVVKGLSDVQIKLSELGQLELDPQSQQMIFGATAGLGMAMGFGRPTDDGRTRFLIEFEAPDSITVNGMQLPF